MFLDIMSQLVHIFSGILTIVIETLNSTEMIHITINIASKIEVYSDTQMFLIKM